MEPSYNSGGEIPDTSPLERSGQPLWLWLFEEEMRYFSTEAIVDAQPDITAEKQAFFLEHSHQLAQELITPAHQATVVRILHSLRRTGSEHYSPLHKDRQAAEVIKDCVTRFTLTFTPLLAPIAFDASNPNNPHALELLAESAGEYGYESLVAPHTTTHIGIYDRYCHTFQRAPQQLAQQLLRQAPTAQQATLATTFDALLHEGFPMAETATAIGETAEHITHPIHRDIPIFISHALKLPPSGLPILHAYLTTRQYQGRNDVERQLKPFGTLADELRAHNLTQASYFQLAA